MVTAPARQFPVRVPATGMTLLELLIAMALATFLAAGLIQIVSAAAAGSRLQDQQALVQENARFAMELLADHIRQAGFDPRPWEGSALPAITAETAEGASAASDRLGISVWSDRNCYGNRNPETDASGRPAFYLRESVFDISASGHLTHDCRYGPSPDDLRTQIPRQGLVPGVESFQLLFAERSAVPSGADRWVRAGQWAKEEAILGVRIGLLMVGTEPVLDAFAESFMVLDTSELGPPDGRLRRVFELTVGIRGRSG